MKKIILIFIPILLGWNTITAQTTLTHSTSQTITPSNSVACSAGAITDNNSYSRSFSLPAFGISTNFQVGSIQFGVEQVATTQPGGFPVIIELHTGTVAYPSGFPGSLTLLAIDTVYLTNADGNTIVNFPMTATVPAGSELVLTISVVADGASTFYLGSNGIGETGPSYIKAAACGITTPTTMNSIGFSNVQWVMNVVELSCTPITNTIAANVCYDGTYTYADGTVSPT